MNDRVHATIGIRAAAGSIALSYNYTAHGRAAEAISQTIWMETTGCALGGHRRWFACPTCSRRVAVLYGAGRLFACRPCKALAYASQSESLDDRAARRADRIRKRLGWEPRILNGPGLKPARMHWRTYERLREQHDALVAVSLAGMARKLGLLRGQLEDIDDAAASWR